MLRIITILLAFIAVATAFYLYGYKSGYSDALADTFITMLDKAKASGLITTPEEVEEFARQYAKIFYESEEE